MSPLSILGGVEALFIGTVAVRVRAALRNPYKCPKKKRTGPILLFDPGSGGSEERKAPPSDP
jgi:hypothetical protein